ncbi:hypothetical protein OK015_08865 [Mycobacterium sp. Aquia_216]|nr:hypothetical protein [Mycobacterium sp. Aquia_216]WAJ46550.1 hypothetical protein OK015_08865 [Mycobacterium sp. Aquia_216]
MTQRLAGRAAIGTEQVWDDRLPGTIGETVGAIEVGVGTGRVGR